LVGFAVKISSLIPWEGGELGAFNEVIILAIYRGLHPTLLGGQIQFTF